MFCVLGLPWQVATKAQFRRENNVSTLQRLNGSTIKLQLIQRTPIQFALCVLLNGLQLFPLANTVAISVAARMRWQVKQKILPHKRREVDRFRAIQLHVHGKSRYFNFVYKFFQTRYTTKLHWL